MKYLHLGFGTCPDFVESRLCPDPVEDSRWNRNRGSSIASGDPRWNRDLWFGACDLEFKL